MVDITLTAVSEVRMGSISGNQRSIPTKQLLLPEILAPHFRVG